MSAEIVDLANRRLRAQLGASLALLNSWGASIPADALKPPQPETDLGFAERMLHDCILLMRGGDLLGTIERLGVVLRYVKWLEELPRKRAERNRKRRERRKAKRERPM